MEIIIDTHALVWYLTADKRLGIKAKKTIDNIGKEGNHLIISVIVLMEVLVLIERQKVKFTWEEFNQTISLFPNVMVYPVGADVLNTMRRAGKGLELHDRILIATALLHNGSIISKDREIQMVKEIKTIW